MRWKKLGRLYAPQSSHPKLASHAANPLAIHLEGDVFRVFFSGRDVENRSSVGFVDVDIISHKILQASENPVFEFGPPGSYYSHGVSIGNCYEAGSKRYVLFMGWQCPQGKHWRGDIGRLRLTSDFSLQLTDDKPLLGVDDTDSVSLSYPWVLRDGGRYHMWYGSTVTWNAGNGEMLHVINHATSIDGHVWHRRGLSVPYELGVAQAFSRPSVAIDSQGYHMWFSYRSGLPGGKYKIGYARSQYGEKWELLLAEKGIDISDSGWDSEMIEYPFVFDHKGQRFMLYNGNSYGKTGFGLAVQES
jgi:hypothetical protein